MSSRVQENNTSGRVRQIPARGRCARTVSLVPVYRTTRDSFRLLALSNVVLLPLAVISYGEKFHLLTSPFSDLGTLHTRGGSSNVASFIIFALYMLSGALIMMRHGRALSRTPYVPYSRLKIALSFGAAAGYVIGIMPHDLVHAVHTAGCSLMVGSLWMLCTVFSLELGRMGRFHDALAVQLILQLSVLPYAVAYFVDADVKQALQKVAVAGLFVSLTAATRFLRREILDAAFRPSGLEWPVT